MKSNLSATFSASNNDQKYLKKWTDRYEPRLGDWSDTWEPTKNIKNSARIVSNRGENYFPSNTNKQVCIPNMGKTESIILFSAETNPTELQNKESVTELTKQLVLALKCYDSTSNTISSAEMEIIDIVDNYSFQLLGGILTEIYTTYFDNSKMMVGICESLKRYNYDKIASWGFSIVTGLTKHKSTYVKEAVVDLVDNWATKDFLPALTDMDCTENWLKSFRDDTIMQIENPCFM